MRILQYLTIVAGILLTSCGSSSDSASADKTSPDIQRDLGDGVKVAEVTTMKLEESDFHHDIVSNGKLTAREHADVAFRSPDIIAEIYVKNGDRVQRGQRLARLDMFKLENNLRQQANTLDRARLDMQDVIIGQGYDPSKMESVPEEVKKLAAVRSGLEQAEASYNSTRRDIEDATLTAPVSGVVANLTAKPHNMASASEPFCRIINDGMMDVEFTVLESELRMIKPGDEVLVAPYSGGEARHGRVTEINPMVDANGMVKVWASVGGGSGLIDGMNARVNVKRSLGRQLVVPKSAVVLRSGRQVVFTLDKDKAMWNYVRTGLENLENYTIEEGLEPGMEVIVTGNVNLAHEAPVKVVNK